MKKKILVTEEQLKLIINFIDKDSSLNEQIRTSGGVQLNTGRGGLTKQEFEKQEKEKREKNLETSEGSIEELGTLFLKKFSSDLGKQTLFKGLPNELKRTMLMSWFNEGGLPEDFYENPDDYKFTVKKMSGGINAAFTGKEGEDKMKAIENIYKDINLENFQNYNGGSNDYKFIAVSKGTGKPIFEDNQPKVNTMTLDGYKLFVIAPGIGKGDEAKISQSSSTPGQRKVFKINVPPIPINFVVEKSSITPEGEKSVKDAITTAFNNSPEIQYAIKNNITYKVTNINIICSASNTWAKKTLPYTHNNDGSKSNIPYDSKVPNALKNLQLAKDRGNTLLSLMKTDDGIKGQLKIKDDTIFDVEGIVTNTNGMTDEQLISTNSDLNKGQFAKFTFTLDYEIETPGKEKQLVVMDNLVISLVKEKSNREFKNLFSMNMSKAKYLDKGGKRKSARAISKNLGNSFRGFGGLLDKLLP
jgi:hypothetical protein